MFGLNKKHTRGLASFVSLGLVLGCLSWFSGGVTHSAGSLSPYLTAAASMEASVFDERRERRLKEKASLKHRSLKMDRARARNEREYDRKVGERILDILSRYRTGLKKKSDDKIPGWILAQSKRYGYDPLFLTALIITESSFNNWAVSHRGAVGLMQLLPGTGKAMARETKQPWRGTSTLHDPEVNIALGSYYLNKLKRRFGDLNLALEAYNHGPTRLDSYLKRGYAPSRYSKKVLKIYEMIHFEPA